ncbi:oligosaccharide flippase family protein [Cylindrospermopsis raciborskii]|uniref:oligosaccharide flippase family protein n=1 Tax=Cylindrospermopsis raciborskii TaxID=77022 RepID=UPI003A95C1B0
MLKNGVYNIIGASLRAVAGIITGPVMSRLMGLEEYGIWALISSVLAFLTVVEGGLSNAITVFLSRDIADKDDLKISETITISLIWMLVLAILASLVLYSTAGIVINYFPGLSSTQQHNSVRALQIGCFSVLCQLLQQVFIGIEQAYHEYKLLSFLKTVQFGSLSVGWIISAHLDGGLVTLATWQLVVTLIVLGWHIYVVRALTKDHNLQFLWNNQRATQIFRYNLAMWLMTIGGILFTRGDRIVVGSVLGPESLAIYAIVSDVASGINFLVAQPIQPFLPVVSRLALDSTSLHALQNKFRQVIQINSCMAVWSGSLVLIFSPLVISYAVGLKASEYNTALFCLQVLALITTIQSLCNTGYYVLMSQDVRYLASILFIGGFSCILLIYLGSLGYGLVGSIIGNFGYNIMTICTFKSAKKFGISYRLTFTYMAFPMFLFFMTFAMNYIFYFPHSIFSFLLVLQCCVVLTWFAFQNNIRIPTIIRSLGR